MQLNNMKTLIDFNPANLQLKSVIDMRGTNVKVQMKFVVDMLHMFS